MKMQFKNIKLYSGKWAYVLMAGLLAGGTLTSCDDVFDTDSSSVTIDKGDKLDSPNDSLYSIMGILSQLQKVGERYVLFGELRGDLMEATSAASTELQEISRFAVTAGNSYRMQQDYYNIINNCNYAIERMDTTVTIYQDKVMIPEYAAIKAVRAWTYWQVLLAYGEVRWIDKPILSLEASMKDYPVKSGDELAQLLIEDLLPYTDVRQLDYGTIDGYSSSKMFLPVPLILGDLYLYLNRYEEAAAMYYKQIEHYKLTVSANYSNNWARDTRAVAYIMNNSSYMDEMLSGLVYSSDSKEYHPVLIRYAYNDNPSIVPAESFVNGMNRKMHFYAEAGALSIGSYFEGDLRGEAVSSSGKVSASSFGNITLGKRTGAYITKYNTAASMNESGSDPLNTAVTGLMFTRVIPLYRTPLVYLRFAEALNRMGKPSMAFAVLKYGLTAENLADESKVNQGELTGNSFTDFSWIHNSDGNANIGTAMRGRGRGIPLDKEYYVIPDYTRYTVGVDEETGEPVLLPSDDAADKALALSDSISFVEDCIVDELAAETSFEGNRFFDLLRIARHRNSYPAYMADKVSARFSNQAEMKAVLMNPDNWYLK
ncbi:MAG: RagB/SusD family nutrient uptake outer membrane protein [Bacteroides sp.]|nr:hypothetical protein [Roseburia sp.]MCM1346121.1 RagB/SusD family nutrient uptake outer membrane protein [Bacteroides sp.]MCM1420886.1 RagB/SusD family nutrient uptake outer membrane protein [Bacteroides sp.]